MDKTKERPKILFLLQFPPPIHGSAIVGKYIKESTLINSTFNAIFFNILTSTTVGGVGKKNIGKFLRFFGLLCTLVKNLTTFRPDLCYLAINSKGIAFYRDCIMVAIVKLFGVNLVYHFHNKGVSDRENKFIDNLLYTFAFKNEKVILLSKYLYPDIQKYVEETNVYYCANGIHEVLAHEYHERLDGPPGILFLSNLFESKGVFVLLEACKQLKEKDVQFQCAYAGNWGDIQEIEFVKRIEEYGLSSYIMYLGPLYGHEKQEVFYKYDIFAHPTFDDCFPLVLLEAMQNGLPIVSTFEGGIADIVEEGITGFLVPKKNAEILAEKLEILIADSLLRMQMRHAAKIRYNDFFTIDDFEKRMASILSDIIT